MRRVFLVIAVLALLVGTVSAAKLPPRHAPPTASWHMDLGRSMFEGFEGAFPPAGWSQGITNPTNTWRQDNVTVYEGMYAAKVDWQAGVPQDETLSFDYTVEDGDVLQFFTMGSTYWCTNANFTCEIDGAVVYDFCAEATASWEWQEVVIDLAPYVGQTITVTFRYAGDDGADQHLDAVQVGPYSPPPPPPPVDFCDLLEDTALGNGDVYVGDTCDGQNLVSSLDCASFTENGLEDYFEVAMPAGSSFTATVTYDAVDGALWVLGECSAEGGEFTCLGYADETLTGEPEVVTYTNDTGMDQIVYLVVDAWGTDACGTYSLVFESTGGAVANETKSFGAVKALYR